MKPTYNVCCLDIIVTNKNQAPWCPLFSFNPGAVFQVDHIWDSYFQRTPIGPVKGFAASHKSESGPQNY